MSSTRQPGPLPKGNDELYLQHTLALAVEAQAFASPNPTVGCVLAIGDEAIGEGVHLYDQRDHAEIAALKQAASSGRSARGATAYVTLEPCSHHGRTGPCADALIAAGIARCVVATVDPNSLVSGQGLAKLRAAGVEVVVAAPASAVAQQARRINDAFAFSIRHNRPFVTLKSAVSVDGMIAPHPGSRAAREPVWLTGPAARADVQLLRHAADALLTGIGTVLADDPALTDRTGLPRRRPLLRVVLDSGLRTPLDSTLVTTAANDLLVLCGETASPERETALTACGVEVVRLHDNHGHLNLTEAFAALAERNLLSLLVEAGSGLNSSLLRADLVDKLVLYYAERELGLNAVPFAADYDSPYVLQQRLTSTTRTTFPNDTTEDVRIAGYLHDPWANVLTPHP